MTVFANFQDLDKIHVVETPQYDYGISKIYL